MQRGALCKHMSALEPAMGRCSKRRGCSHRLMRMPLECRASSHRASGAHLSSSRTWISTAHKTRALQLASGASLHSMRSL